jgi:hypothetical protein
MTNAVFADFTLCCLKRFTDNSKGLSASIFRINSKESGGSTLLRHSRVCILEDSHPCIHRCDNLKSDRFLSHFLKSKIRLIIWFCNISILMRGGMHWFSYTVTLHFKRSRDSSVGIATGWTRIKRQVCEADHSLPFTAEVKYGGAIPPLLNMSSWKSA